MSWGRDWVVAAAVVGSLCWWLCHLQHVSLKASSSPESLVALLSTAHPVIGWHSPGTVSLSELPCLEVYNWVFVCGSCCTSAPLFTLGLLLKVVGLEKVTKEPSRAGSGTLLLSFAFFSSASFLFTAS